MEFADELVDGTRSAVLPAMQHGLGLSYGQLGLLASVPLLLGGALELPLGMLAGHGRRRRLAVLGGGVLFVLSIAAVAFARTFVEVLAAFVLFYPAAGAFVTLTQAALMDAASIDDEADGHASAMARWDMAGWAGALTGPLLFTVVLAAGGGWRESFGALAVAGVLAWVAILTARPDTARPDTASAGQEGGAGDAGEERPAGWRELRGALRWGVLRWLVLLEVANWLVDVLTGFVAVYLVDVAHYSPTVAALAVAVRLAAGMGGDALLIGLLRHTSDLDILRGTSVAAVLLFPGFLVVPGLAGKLVLLVLLSAATAMWYPLLQARLYGAVSSPVAVTLSSAAGLAGGLGPLAVGVAAGLFGLSWALAGLTVVPLALFAASSRLRADDRSPPRNDQRPPPAHPGRS